MRTPTAFIHDKALVDPGATVGAGTRVWGFTHILAGARIGADCNICEQVFRARDTAPAVSRMSMALCAASLDGGVDLDPMAVPLARRADEAPEPSGRRAGRVLRGGVMS